MRMKRKEPEAQKKKYYPILYPHPEFCYVCGATEKEIEVLPSGLCGKCFEKVWGALPEWVRLCRNGHGKKG